ncbi:MAG: hypothetical protein IJU87_09280 [Lachnospiraceae bacterium]|nr:hypothetical protein [Lachnospiraceae bacterium]
MSITGFNFGAAACEGIMASLILGLVSKKRPDFRSFVYAALILCELISTVLRYSGYENPTFFFAHPYIAFLVADISDYSNYVRGLRPAKEAVFEKLILWPLIVIPIFSAFITTTGWLIKLYVI